MSRKLIEAALFMSSRTMSADEIAKVTGVTPRNVEKTLDAIVKEYASEGKGVEVIRNPEGWEMRVKPEVLPKVAHLTPYSDLRDGHKRTLALVVYKEPVKQSHVVEIQGNKAYAYIKKLRKKGLLKAEKEGRTVKLSVTKEFERYFGLDRQKIKEMLHNGLQAAKAKDQSNEQASLARMTKPEAKPANLTSFATEKRPVESNASPVTPPTNFQYVETKPAVAKPDIAGKVPEEKVVSRRSKKATPAGKIGTNRPVAE
ncbi:MAG: SMC-Scp complex subunit ScpB [Candidatus Aenigmarchaeota archaeon]|nr:SMC-Scp complex subunit ScpB [Candidatus Aenigmarchaeota archaeon]